MGRPDGRIEKGQRLNRAISARAWNRAQDAADVVLGVTPGFEAGPLNMVHLPSVRVLLSHKGWFGECRFATADVGQGQVGVSPAIPVNIETLGNETDSVKSLVSFTLPGTTRSSVSYAGGTDGQSGLFVCVGNNSNEYAMAGFAITRIRVFNFLHRYARSPISFTGQTDQQGNNVAGCLDSAFWGPAKIVGFFNNKNGLEHGISPLLTFPQFVFRWALIQF